jgi:hypothetical protein
MTDQTPVQSNTPAENTAAPQPSLEDISKEFSVEEQTRSFTAQPQQPQPAYPQYTPPPQVPDPVINPDAFLQYAWQQNPAVPQLTNQLQQVSAKLQAFEQQQAQAKLEADVNRAVSKVNEKLKVDPLLAEAALEAEYRRNPTFKHIWDNRDRNPAAFDRALEVMGNQLSTRFAVRTDPQLLENQRAAVSSQRTMATNPQSNPAMDALKMPQGDFEAWWEATKRGF